MSKIELPRNASMKELQKYVHDLEEMHGWLDVDLVHTCFLMGEEVGELFKAVRRCVKLFDESSGQAEAPASDLATRKAEAGDEIVDVLNYLLAVANRLDIDVEEAFRRKNE